MSGDRPLADVTPVELAIAKLDLRAGDVLVLQVNERLDRFACARIREYLSSILPSGAKAMVLDRGMSLSVVRREDLATTESPL